MTNLGLAPSNSSPINNVNLKLIDSNSPTKNFGVKDLLKAQIEEKRLLEIKNKIKDRNYYNLIQKNDEDASNQENENRAKNKLVRDSYIKSLKDQMREQQRSKFGGFEMDDREKKINREQLKMLVKANPLRHKRKAMKLGTVKSRNGNVFEAKTHDRQENATFDYSRKINVDRSVDDIKVLDLTKDVKMPTIKPELKIDKPDLEKDTRSFYGKLRNIWIKIFLVILHIYAH